LYLFIRRVIKQIVVIILVGRKKKPSVKIQCVSDSFDIADLNMTTELPLHTPTLRRMAKFKNYIYSKKVLYVFLITLYSVK
jgi:hypothetical protein